MGGLGESHAELFTRYPFAWKLDVEMSLGATATHRGSRRWLASTGIETGRPLLDPDADWQARPPASLAGLDQFPSGAGT